MALDSSSYAYLSQNPDLAAAFGINLGNYGTPGGLTINDAVAMGIVPAGYPGSSGSSTLQSTLPAGLPGALAQLGVSELKQFACNLFPSLCDGGGSSLMQTTAPKAGLISGACPPGRKIRHVAFGRDICVRKPRMNYLNPKALTRATRRLAGFQMFATKTEKAIRASFIKAGVRPGARRSSGACGTCRKKTCGGC